MSTPEAAGPARPARLAGLVLLALAGIALVVGLISVIGGNEPEQGASPPPSSQPPATEQSSTATPPPPPPSTTPPSSTTSSVATPPPATPPPGTPAGPDRTQPVRVYNNSTIKGLADRAAGDFRGTGWNVVTVDNYPGGVIATTTVYFRQGTPEEAAAKDLAKQFNLRVEPRFQGIQDADPGIIVIVTREYNPKTK